MPPKKGSLGIKTSGTGITTSTKTNKTELVPTIKCYDCLDYKELACFDYRDKSTGLLWRKCIVCRKNQANAKEKANREKSIDDGKLTCRKCDKTMTLDKFTPRKNTGYYVQCTQCRIAMGK